MRKIASVLLLALSASLAVSASDNVFRKAEIAVSSSKEKSGPEFINDGDLSRASTWISNRWNRPPHIVEINLKNYCRLDSIVIHTGILPAEMKESETGKAAGYWCMKNFILQYWDDANWTDISGTVTTENRKERVAFHFTTPVTSWRFRVHCTDGESIRIREIEGFGIVNTAIPAPSSENIPSTLVELSIPDTIAVKVNPSVEVGRTMHFVGYNQGYFVPGSNARAWWEYSGVNAARLWADLKTYVHTEWLKATPAVNSQEEFETQRTAFLADGTSRVPFGKIAAEADKVIPTTNTMSLNFAMKTLSDLGVDMIIQSGIGRKSYGATWQDKWELWQKFYCFAYYTCKVGGVQMWAMCNEPNHRNAGPMPLDSWISLSKIMKDALVCAVEEVNRETGASRKALLVGPVTAGTNTDWWSAVAASQRTDWRGNRTENDIVDIFSTHSYNIPAAGYIGRMDMINGILSSNHPEGKTMPVVFTETGRWMNAYLIDKEETMDSPSLFTEWAGMYVANMLGGCHGMWAFKFANTASSTYPRGIKSGHHFIWKGARFAEDSFVNLALGAKALAGGKDASAVTDGSKSSAWISEVGEPHKLEISFDSPVKIGALALYSGSEGGEFTAPDRVKSYKLELVSEDGSVVPVCRVKADRYAQEYFTIEKPVNTCAIRFEAFDKGSVKIREIKAFGDGTISAARESYDVAGMQRTAEVVRLFAKGFKGDNPLVEVKCSAVDRDVDIVSSKVGKKTFLWLVNRTGKRLHINLDLSSVLKTHSAPVIVETVDERHYGEASIHHTSSEGKIMLHLEGKAVALVTAVECEAPATIACSGMKTVRLEGGKGNSVEMNYSDMSRNAVTYISFDTKSVGNASRILLDVGGVSTGKDLFRFHVYGFPGKTVLGKRFNWASAPHLYGNESLVKSSDPGVFVAGELTMTDRDDRHFLDVTDAVLRHCGKDGVTFILVRELRESGDDYDNFCGARLDVKAKPQLICW